MSHRTIPIQPKLRLPRAGMLLMLLCLCAIAVACSESDPVNPLSAEPQIMSSAAAKIKHTAIMKQGMTPEDFALQADLTVLSYSPSSRLAVFEGKKNVNPNVVEEWTNTFEGASPLSVSHDIDLLMGFQEAIEFTEVDGQPAFGMVDWATTHDYAVGSGVKIAILDSGADFSHPWLQYRLVDLEVEGLPSADEAWDYYDPHMGEGAWGHGTHVAGIIAATAPGAELWPIPVLSPAGASTSVELALGLQAALDHGADIVNLSLRLEAFDPTVEELLRQLYEAGIHVLAAAGNMGDDTPVYPASSPYTIAVAMVDNSDNLHEYSARGPNVELAAPGVDVASAYPTKYGVDPYRKATGTSMACASASGALACIMGPHDRPRPSPPLERLLETAGPIAGDPTLIVDGRIRPTNALMVFPSGGF